MRTSAKTTINVSKTGRITIPTAIRKQLLLKPGSKLEIEVEGDKIILRRVRSIMDVAGIFRGTTVDETKDWETIRTEVEEAVAREVMEEDQW